MPSFTAQPQRFSPRTIGMGAAVIPVLVPGLSALGAATLKTAEPALLHRATA